MVTDSRKIIPGCVFLPFRVNALTVTPYVSSALEKGAAGCYHIQGSEKIRPTGFIFL